MKNKIVILIILFISACSSVPKIEKSESTNTLIQKPEFNYKIKSLPKSIKIYFDQRDDESELPLEVQGFIANSFTYSSKISYKPKISFSNFKSEECINDVIKEDLIISAHDVSDGGLFITLLAVSYTHLTLPTILLV